ncbi:MAG: YbaB/EbfC family nucleoid-associated protein [Bacilli bacterium]|jgi:DNA-binding YbaB/EbfC family protein|nr:YbaB/EbfC family nucleoid-associated protein [Bacilli bacterium]
MNIQNMLKQAKKIQADLEKKKTEIDQTIFKAKYSYVEVEANGKKEILRIKIDEAFEMEKEDREMLADMIMVAVNNVLSQIDKEINNKIGKLGGSVPGLF